MGKDNVVEFMEALLRHEAAMNKQSADDLGIDLTLPNGGVLNARLAKRQGITQEDADALKRLHSRKDEIFAEMKELHQDAPELQAYVKELEEVEFAMQRAWKFEEDASRHSWWYRAPHCLCPKMDNADPLYGDKITQANCPLHGWDY